jgi:hypothetical protein
LTSGAEDTCTFAGLVAWATIFFFITYVIVSWSEPNQWHLAVQFRWVLFINTAFLSVPASTIHIEAVHIDTVLRSFINLVN